jgi:hypothetical protein
MNPERTIFRFHGGSWGLGAAMAVVYLDAMPWWIILVAAAGLLARRQSLSSLYRITEAGRTALSEAGHE